METIRNYEITLSGLTPLLLHHDDIEWADAMTEWRDNPKHKKESKAGDDRSPAWRWIGCLYHDEKVVGVAGENISRFLMEGAVMVPVPGGRSGKTFKAQSQSGMKVGELLVPLEFNGGSYLDWSKVAALMDESEFKRHVEAAKKLGFRLFTKRARVGGSKHVRVRPRFDSWSLRFTIQVWDKQITEDALADIIKFAGAYKGLCDWRPGSKTPGPYGICELAEMKELKA